MGAAGVAGIVVAGGAAARMGGVDKCLLPVGAHTLLDRVLLSARRRCDPLVVVGPDRPTTVAGITFVGEARPGGGPVPAVAAGLAAVGEAATVLVLAGDLPLFSAADLDRLLAPLADPAVPAAAAALGPEGRPHPLLVAHRTGALRERVGAVGPDGGRGLPAAQLLPPRVVAVDLGPDATLNVNDPADLGRARALVERSRG